MRLLQLVQSLERGGAERILLDLDAGARSLGHSSRVITLYHRNEFTEAEYRSVETEALIPREAFRWPYYVPRAAKQLGGFLREWRPDAMLIHTPNAAAVAAWRPLPVPAVQVFHWRWDAFGGEGWRGARRRLMVRRTFARLGKRGIVVSPPLTADSARYLGCGKDRLRCVINGVDLERFPFSERRPVSAPRIAVVGALSELKCPDQAIRAFSILRGAIPGARLRMIGDGPLRPALESLRKELGLEGAVEFAGLSSGVPGLLAECDLFWHLSRSEGFGLAVAEAMATGLPAVGYDVPGIRDAILDGVTGRLVPFGDVFSVAKVSEALLTDHSGYRRISGAARKRAEAEYDARRMVTEYLAAAADAAEGRW